MKLSVNFIPAYDRSAASSRLRVYAIAEALDRLELAETSIGLCERTMQSDIIVLQKVGVSALFSRLTGHPGVIYDYDDPLGNSVFSEVAAVARLFTSDTSAHALLCGRRCELLPDPIDYASEAPMPQAEPSGLAWFGNHDNFQGCQPLFESASGYASLGTISRIPVSDSAMHIPWSYDSFPTALRSRGTAFLSHCGLDQGKSANRMVAAVALGVPCIVNESPAYETLARDVGLGWCIVSTPEELKAAYERLQFPEERSAYLKAIQPYVWEHYHVDSVARRFMEIVRSI